jgi:hypothetical protein
MTICDKNLLLKPENCKSYGNSGTQMAEFQLAGPAADVSKILYGESHKSIGRFHHTKF